MYNIKNTAHAVLTDIRQQNWWKEERNDRFELVLEKVVNTTALF